MILYQVTKLLPTRIIIGRSYRYVNNGSSQLKYLFPLKSRKLLKISGEDVATYLQGLITNDMRHFEEEARCIYAMFLNNKGRVLYDTLIYKWDQENSFLVECDSKILGALQKHLKLFKLKRKLEIADFNNDFKLWALIAPETAMDSSTDKQNNVHTFKDPRIPDLGFRVIASANLKGTEVAQYISNDIIVENNEGKYKYLRYSLGVSEGSDDIPPGSSFPLEANCDYLHGVSFHKGCYIGQELTARVHHTGVVRKRMMPLKFSQSIKENLEKDLVIKDSTDPKANIGKLKGFVDDYGLGLVRIKEALESKNLVVGNYSVKALKPSWWPIEAPKEKININKLE